MKIIVSYACVILIIIIFNHYHCTSIIFLDCESETPRGKKQSKDVPNGGQADITCSGGCIHFVEVTFNERTILYVIMAYSQAMFGCNNDQTRKHPNKEQKQINENQLVFMKEKCEGKEFCSARACDSWWGTNLQCPGHEPAFMWLQWHCNGNTGGGIGSRIYLKTCKEGTYLLYAPGFS